MMTVLLALSSFSRKFLPGIVVSLIRVASIFSGLAIALGAETPQAIVKSESVQVHSKMDETSDVVMTLKKGDAVVIEISFLGKGNVEWCSIRETTRKQGLGYVRCEFLVRSAASKAAAGRVQAVPVQSAVPGAGQQPASHGYWEPAHKDTLGEFRYLTYARILATNFGFSQGQKDQSLKIADRIGLLACIEDTGSYARQGLTPPDLFLTPRSHRTTQCDWTFQSFIEQVFALVTPEQQASNQATYARFREEIASHRRALITNSR
jgi:hypothetical protein